MAQVRGAGLAVLSIEFVRVKKLIMTNSSTSRNKKNTKLSQRLRNNIYLK